MAETLEELSIGEMPDVSAQFPGRVILERLGKREGHWSGKGQDVSFTADEVILVERLEAMGTGSFGDVSKSELSFDKQTIIVATKEIRNSGLRPDEVKNEIDILKSLQHRHLVTFIGSYRIAITTTIIMYPCASCDLEKLLVLLDKAAQHANYQNEATQQLSELGWVGSSKKSKRLVLADVHSQLRRICGCITSGVLYLHQKKIRHKDIKPSNILIDRQAVYITDFSVSGNYTGRDSSQTSGPYAGTWPYSAPECFYKTRGRPSDMYSLGRVFMDIFTYITGKSKNEMERDFPTEPPHRATEPEKREELVHRNAQVQMMRAMRIFHDSGKENHGIRDLIYRMISQNEEHRPYAFEVVSELWAISPNGQYFCDSCRKHKDCFGYKGLFQQYRRLQKKYLKAQEELSTASHNKVTQLKVQTAAIASSTLPSRSPISKRLTPTPDGPTSQTTTRQGRTKPTIDQNEHGDRLDLAALGFARNIEFLDQPSRDRLEEIRRMGACRNHYLKQSCKKPSDCAYEHEDELDESDLEMLDYVVRVSSPCLQGKRCTVPACMYGHHCLEGANKDDHICKFSTEMHVRKIVPV
ncbi:kinase-like domain-containing protein, partial [Thelonectria olida]